ncbi:MAG: HIT family protein [Candidatus Bathyarchaeota archaeon]|nr:HIT family protein [Candidatus Bathyarchaeota archaeon]
MVENCLFCKIIRKELPASFVYEDDTVVAFLSNHPVNLGHTLVVPKKHYATIYDIPEEEAAYLFSVAKRVAHAVRDAVDAEGLRIVQNNGEAGGQVVFHLHIHVIPMRPHNLGGHDGAFRDRTSPRSAQDLEEDAETIRRQF